MMGFGIIREMTKEQLIEEIVEDTKATLEQRDMAELKAIVVDIRVANTRKRLTDEAGVNITQGLFGRSAEEREE